VRATPSAALTAWLTAVVPPLATSIDKLSDLPDRMRLLFAFDAGAALARPDVGAEAREPLAQSVARAFAEAMSSAPPLTTKEAFRALAKQVGAATGAKGKTLFHTIRLVCTGEPDGPELDLLVPAIEQAAMLVPADGLAPVMSCRARATAFVAALSA
jgi:glutamyl-tRNA synthetase/nondiscriminating glutamyl-tRNA synthetase